MIKIDMVKIPRGIVHYPGYKISFKIEYDFYIDVFPITYELYHAFLCEHPEIEVPFCDVLDAEPFNWNRNSRMFPYGKADHPVVNVWGDNLKKFCLWRSQIDDKRRQFDLPSRNEWVMAAGGDGRIYPWGDQFNQDKCNTLESHLKSTTSVHKYPNGLSPYGCWDMAGNVWEKIEMGAILGGCWAFNQDCARADSDKYDGQSSDIYEYYMGFRCVARSK